MNENTTVSNNQRLAKNTIVLYLRMAIVIIVNLFISRLVLDTLGVSDYGIYNVVGGFVTLFSLLSGALSNSISRFITFELGKGDLSELKKVFSTSVMVQVMISLAIGLLIEVVGVWFLNYKLQIPEDRMLAANWVLQCSVITFILNLVSVPYNGCIIAHERMTAFAYISIFEVFLKLSSVLLLYLSYTDNLILYSVLLTLSALIVRLIYGIYCKKNFEECTTNYTLEKRLVKKMFSLASWNMLGSGAGMLNDQGTNIMMNLFFGVTVNAAKGIAMQVNAAVQQFAASFITALNPQLTKLYSQERVEDLQKLLHAGIKYSYFLMYLIALPVLIEAPFILQLWLKIVPEYTSLFVRLTILIALATVSGNLLFTVVMATGKIKKYQIVIGICSISIFIITTILFLLGCPPQTAFIVHLCMDVVILFARLIIINEMVDIKLQKILIDLIPRIIVVSGLSAMIPIFLHLRLDGITSLLAVFVSSIVCTVLFIMLLGLTPAEKEKLFVVIKNKLNI